jgi:hypothetical protein
LAQAPGAQSLQQARAIATQMGLEFEYRHTGYGTLESTLITAVKSNGARRGGDALVGDACPKEP